MISSVSSKYKIIVVPMFVAMLAGGGESDWVLSSKHPSELSYARQAQYVRREDWRNRRRDSTDRSERSKYYPLL